MKLGPLKPERYMLFAGMTYYPSGGWKDYRGSFTTLEAALAGAANLYSDRDWWHIVDRDTGEILREGKSL